jgi:predicted DNA-binding transcriptional regulator YafY
VVTIWRDWLTNEVLAKFELNDRQKQAIDYLKVKREITNRDYQTLTGAISQTALRDLRELMAFGLVDKIGKTGRATHYRLRKKPDINPTNTTKCATTAVGFAYQSWVSYETYETRCYASRANRQRGRKRAKRASGYTPRRG